MIPSKFAILSGFQNQGDRHGDVCRDQNLHRMLNFAFGHARVFRAEGSYKGDRELAWFVNLDGFGEGQLADAYMVIESFAETFEQETWLEGYSESCCYLVVPKNPLQLEAIGYWTEIDNPEAHDSWTKIGGRFYTTTTLDQLD